MVDVGDKDALRAWFSAQPQDVAMVIATRAALRTLPLMGGKTDGAFIVELSLFRAIAAPWVAAHYPQHADTLRAAALVTLDPGAAARELARFAARADAVERVTARIGDNQSAGASARVAVRSAGALILADTTTAPRLAEAAIIAAVFATDERSAVSLSVAGDVGAVESGISLRDIITRPLWPEMEASADIATEWQHLRERCLQIGQDWDVWTDWYDRILEGRGPLDHEIELFRVTLDSEDDWKLLPREINAKIKAKILEVEARWVAGMELPGTEVPNLPPLPAPSDRTDIFSTDPAKPIDLAIVDQSASLGTSLERREGYIELRSLALDMRDLGDNRLGRLLAPCSRFLTLGSVAEHVRPFSFWVRSNALRNVLRDHEASTDASEPDERRLDPIVAGQLQTFVEAFQVYCLGDLRLLRNEQSRPGPRETQTAQDELQPLKPVLQSLVSDVHLATQRAADVLTDARDAIETASDDLTGRQGAELGRVTLSNLVLSLLVKAKLGLGPEGAYAWKEFRGGIYKYAGGAAVVGVAAELGGQPTVISTFFHFMAANADALIVYAKLTAMNPGVVNFLRWIQAQFGR